MKQTNHALACTYTLIFNINGSYIFRYCESLVFHSLHAHTRCAFLCPYPHPLSPVLSLSLLSYTGWAQTLEREGAPRLLPLLLLLPTTITLLLSLLLLLLLILGERTCWGWTCTVYRRPTFFVSMTYLTLLMTNSSPPLPLIPAISLRRR